MRAIFIILLSAILASNASFAQFNVGASGMSIQAGTPVFIDSFTITPSANYTIAANTLTVSNSADSIMGAVSINRVYSFSTPLTAYSGALGIYYGAAELNGNDTSSMHIAYTSNGTSWNIDHTGGNNSNYVYTASSGIVDSTIKDITAISSQIYYSKSAGDITNTAVWGVNTDGTGTPPANFTWPLNVYDLTNRTGAVNQLANWTVGGELIINAGIDLEVNTNALTLNNRVMSSGTIGGNGSSDLTIGGQAGTINFTSTANRFHSVAVNGDLVIGDTLKMAAGSAPGTVTVGTGALLNTNNKLVLLSDAGGTGSVGNIAGTVAGEVTLQRYIQGGRRAFRFFGHPYSTSIPLGQLEDNIDITGYGTTDSGFTLTYTNNPSAFWYYTYTGDGSVINDSTGWKAFTGSDDRWNRYEGVRVLVRGQKYEGTWVCDTCYTPSPVTIVTHGPINQGALDIPMAVGDTSAYNLLSNPYPSSVDIGTVIYNGQQSGNIAGPIYWVWNTYDGVQGAYIPLPIGAADTYNLESSASFEVAAAYDGAILHFDESNKSAAPDTNMLRTTAVSHPYVMLHLFDTTNHEWDRLYLSFNDMANDSFEHNVDGGKLHNANLDFYSLASTNKHLSFDSRPYTIGQVIPLGITTDKPRTFNIRVDNFTVPTGAQLFLHDKYLGTYTELSLGNSYSFTITGDTASQGDNRLELAMAGDVTTSTANVTSSQLITSLYPNPATTQSVLSYSLPVTEAVVFRLINMAGVQEYYKDEHLQKSGRIIIPLDKITAGSYIAEITVGDKKIIKKLIKE